MGIVEETLASFALTEFESGRIERNRDGTIHIHMEGFRIELSPSEFAEVATTIRRGRRTLRALKVEDGAHEQSS